MKVLIHHTVKEDVFNQFEKIYIINNDTNQKMYQACSRYIDAEILESNYLFVLIIAYFNLENKQRNYKFFELSRSGKNIFVNTVRIELKSFIKKNIERKDLENFSYGYYQVLSFND